MGIKELSQSSAGGIRITSKGLNRHKEVVITRLRLGHTELNSTLAIIGKSNGVMVQSCRGC